MPDVIWQDRPELREPGDGLRVQGLERRGRGRLRGGVGFIHDHFESAEVARIDPEEFYDFTAVRPTVRLTEGQTREIDWPRERGLGGPRPGRRRRPRDAPRHRALAALAALLRTAWSSAARELDVRMVITLGALLADVPHTRPVSITGHRLRPGAGGAARLRAHELRGPDRHRRRAAPRLRGAGLPSASLWASVPHYVAAAPNPKVALALVRAFEGAAGVAVDAGELEEAGRGLRAPGHAPRWPATPRSRPSSSASSGDGRGPGGARRGAIPSRHDRPRLPALPAPGPAG